MKDNAILFSSISKMAFKEALFIICLLICFFDSRSQIQANYISIMTGSSKDERAWKKENTTNPSLRRRAGNFMEEWSLFIACVVSWLKLAPSDKKITRNVLSKSEKSYKRTDTKSNDDVNLLHYTVKVRLIGVFEKVLFTHLHKYGWPQMIFPVSFQQQSQTTSKSRWQKHISPNSLKETKDLLNWYWYVSGWLSGWAVYLRVGVKNWQSLGQEGCVMVQWWAATGQK